MKRNAQREAEALLAQWAREPCCWCGRLGACVWRVDALGGERAFRGISRSRDHGDQRS